MKLIKWADCKKIIDDYSLSYSEIVALTYTFLILKIGNDSLWCELNPANTDEYNDYVNNYQSNAIKDIKRIHSNTRYSPRFYTNNSELEITSQQSDTTILSLDFDGQVNGISTVFNRNDVDLIIICDGEEIFRQNGEDLDDNSLFNLEDNDINFDVRVLKNGEHFVINWKEPMDIINNLTIKARKTTSNTVELDRILVSYKEKINGT